jgi:hypothetical protein
LTIVNDQDPCARRNVLVSDPATGDGIFIENMPDAAGYNVSKCNLPLSFFCHMCYDDPTVQTRSVDFMPKIMNRIALSATAMTLICAAFYMNTENGFSLTLAITFGTISYHFIMRLLVGFIINSLLNNHVDYRRRWFQVSAAEQALYKKIKVKKWKGNMATYNPSSFDSRIHTWDEIAQAMCQAEIVHEVIIVLSFLPILASIAFGALFVFVITSVLAACYDAMFVIMQRYNRPRVIKLIKKSEEP